MFQTEGEYSATAMDIIRKLISIKVAPDKKNASTKEEERQDRLFRGK